MSETVGYAIGCAGHGTFTPDGRADDIITDASQRSRVLAAHNAEVERAELATWADRPERWQVYIVDSGTRHNNILVGTEVVTWLGTVLGTVTYAHTFQHNFGSRMTCIRFRGTNGATYSGRFGSDWSQLCRVRKVR